MGYCSFIANLNPVVILISFFQQITNSNLNSVCSILSLRDIFDVENETSISFDIFYEIDLIIITYEDFNVFHRCSNYFLNTSFNDKGQPIIMSPELAVDFIKKNPVDVLAIGNYLVINK